MSPKSADEFEKDGKKAGLLRLEDYMEAHLAYTVRELESLTGRTYTRINYKLKELESEDKAMRRIIENVTYWRLTSKAYLEGTTKPRVKKKKRGPGRPSEWVR